MTDDQKNNLQAVSIKAELFDSVRNLESHRQKPEVQAYDRDMQRHQQLIAALSELEQKLAPPAAPVAETAKVEETKPETK